MRDEIHKASRDAGKKDFEVLVKGKQDCDRISVSTKLRDVVVNRKSWKIVRLLFLRRF